MEDNPYAAPRDPIDDYARPVDPGFDGGRLYPSEAELRAFVGKKAGYYIGKWSPTLIHSLPVGGFNWAAFFFTGLWLAYRKMYRALAIVLGFFAAETIVEMMIVAGGLAQENTVTVLGRFIALVFSIVCGKFGNSWYLAHATRQVAGIRALGRPEAEYYKALKRRGRPSMVALLGFVVVVFLLGVGIAVVFDLLLPTEE